MITAYFDGAISKNPGGRASCGILIYEDGKEIYRETRTVGDGDLMSCNVAEYAGLERILWLLDEYHLHKEEIKIYGDSQIVIFTMQDKRKPFSKGLCKNISIECKKLAQNFPLINYQWIPREQNYECDLISK